MIHFTAGKTAVSHAAVAEWLKALVLKTSEGDSPQVRILPAAPNKLREVLITMGCYNVYLDKGDTNIGYLIGSDVEADSAQDAVMHSIVKYLQVSTPEEMYGVAAKHSIRAYLSGSSDHTSKFSSDPRYASTVEDLWYIEAEKYFVRYPPCPIEPIADEELFALLEI